MTSSHPDDPAALLADRGWLSALARGLLEDEHAVEDVLQETRLRAWRHPAPDPERAGGWLRRIATNVAHRMRSSDAARRAREVRSARPEAAAATDELVTRVELQRTIAEAVLALDEPYRSAILLRFFDDLPPRAIAERLGVPVETVRTRLKRGLARLRERLDQTHGDRAIWGVALLPLTLPSMHVAKAAAGASGATTLGYLTMSTATRMTIAAAVLLTASLSAWLVVDARDADNSAEVVVGASSTMLVDPPRPTEANEAELARAEDKEVRAEAADANAQSAPAVVDNSDRAVHIDGRFVDAQGRGIPGVRILQPLREDGEVVASDARGDFALPIGPMPAAIPLPFEARAEGWAVHFSEVPIAPGTTTHCGPIVLEPGGTVTGKVVDETGAAVSGARILTTGPVLTDEAVALQRAGPKLDYRQRSKPVTAVTRSGEDGTFRLEGVRAERLRVWAGHTGRRWAFSEPVDVPAAGVVEGVVLELVPRADDDGIDGVVLDPDGAPVAQAILNYGFHAPDGSQSNSTRSDADGRFEIPVVRKVPHRVHCAAPRSEWPAIALENVEPGTHGLVIRMRAGTPLDLRVSDEKGEPIEDFDYTVMADGYGTTRRAHADSKGRVVIDVPAKSFTVEVSAPGRLSVVLGPLDPAATGEVLRCTLESVPGLRGRVLVDGKPVAGAKVSLHRLVGPGERIEIGGFPSRLYESPLESSKTDEAGRFVITPQERGAFALLCDATGYALAEVSPLEVDPRAEREEIVVDLTRGGVIEGRVLTPEGRDAAGVFVGITRFDGRAQTMRVAADGRFRFENLCPGGWRVTRSSREIAQVRGFSFSSGGSQRPSPFEPNCTVEDGAVTAFDLDLREVFDVVFVGHIAVNGQPAAGWTVMLTPEDVTIQADPPTGTVSDAGNVRVALPRAAPYRLDLVPPSETGAPLRISRKIAIHGGENVLTADVECGALEGVVTADRARHQLSCASVGGAEWSVKGIVTWGDDGRFRVSHLPIGTARLRLTDTKAEGGWQTVADEQVDVTRAATTIITVP